MAAKTITIFKAPSKGLNAKTDPVKLGPDELAIATNVVISDQGRIDRRTGYSATLRGEVSSIYSAGGYLLGVVSGDLCVIEPTGGTTVLSAVNSDQPVRYLRLGDTVYITSPAFTGKVSNRAFTAWTAGTYVGPGTDRQFFNAPRGQAIEHHSGRVYIAAESVVWYSEAFAYDWFELAKGFLMFPERVTNMASVADGMWFTTLHDAYFLAGMNPARDVSLRKITGAGAAEGAMVKIPGRKVASGENPTDFAAWCGRSICVGGASGQIIDISTDKLVLPTSNYGCGYYSDGHVTFVLKV